MPETTRRDHLHPMPGAQIVKEHGNKVSNATSDTFKLGDLIAHSSGGWRPISRSLVGQVIPASDLNYYIRPVGWYTS